MKPRSKVVAAQYTKREAQRAETTAMKHQGTNLEVKIHSEPTRKSANVADFHLKCHIAEAESKSKCSGSGLHLAFIPFWLSHSFVLIHSVFKNVTIIKSSKRLPYEFIG
jgi:hypothetical protein